MVENKIESAMMKAGEEEPGKREGREGNVKSPNFPRMLEKVDNPKEWPIIAFDYDNRMI